MTTKTKLAIRTVIFIVFFNIINYSSAQNIDSLLSELDKIKQTVNHNQQFDLYKKLANAYHKQRDYALAILYLNKSLEIVPNKKQKMLCYKIIGNVYVDSTNYDLALENLNEAIRLNNDIQVVEEFSKLYNLQGMCYGLTNNLDKAIESFKLSLNYDIKTKDSSSIAQSYYNIGLANYFKGIKDLAIENYIKSANIREAYGDTAGLVTSLISIGEIFRNKKEYDKAEKYYLKATQYKNTVNDSAVLAYLYSEMALVFKKKKEFNKAYSYIDTAMTICKSIGYKRGCATLTSYKAGIEKLLGNNEKAFELYNQTIVKYNEIGFETGVIQSKIAVCEILLDNKKYDEILNILDEIEPLAKQNNLLEESTNILKIRYKTYKATKKYNQALTEHEKYMILKDSLFNIKKEEKLNELETVYQTKKKEKQIEILDQENKVKEQKIKSRNYILISVSLFFMLLFITVFSFYKQKKIEAELESEQNKHKLLRSQMNPHFIYNSLSAIQNYILKHNPIESTVYISEFSSLMRLVLEGARHNLIPLKNDIKLVEAYMKLQKLRFPDVFDYEIKINETLNTEIIKIPPMLSQPFIENAIEHGMKGKINNNGKIYINYSDNAGELVVSVMDNGEGIDYMVSKEKQHESLATKITNERIENIKKTFKLKIELLISSSKKGTEITLIIPQKK